MPNKSQSGFTPIVMVLLLTVIAGSAILVIKNFPLNQPQPTSVVQTPSTSSAQLQATPSSTISSPTIIKAPAITTAKKPTPILTIIPTKTPTGTTASNANNSSPTPTNTPTLAPTNTPTPTAIPVSPFVKVTSPNGGESFKVGNSVTVTWDTNMNLGGCEMQTIDSNNSGTVVGSNVDVTRRSINWTATIGNTSLEERQLKIYMICHDFNGGTQFARSENYFTVRK